MPRPQSLAPGDQFGSWTLHTFCGSGGSGEVWLASDGVQEAAIKVFTREDRGKFRLRFLDEIKVYTTELTDTAGVLRVLDHCLQDGQAAPIERPWFVMTAAAPVEDHLGSPTESIQPVIEAVLAYARTLAALAERAIHHRDIKPANLYWHAGEFLIGDFGVADFPDKSGLTSTGESIGPFRYMAPEMIAKEGRVGESGPADVYSLAKTLWKLATGEPLPPEGTFRVDNPATCFSRAVADPRAKLLDHTLRDATEIEPHLRPTMAAFAGRLSDWIDYHVPPQKSGDAYALAVEQIKESHQGRVRPREEELHEAYDRAGQWILLNLYMTLEREFLHARLDRFSEYRPVELRELCPDGYDGYDGSRGDSCWGIDGVYDSWIALQAGCFHRAQPAVAHDDLKIALSLQCKLGGRYEERLMLCEPFEADTPGLDLRIKRFTDQTRPILLATMAEYVTERRRLGG